MNSIKGSKPKVLLFDWEENPDEVISGFAKALKEFGISIIEIDTQSDAFAVVIGDKSLTKSEAVEVYNSNLVR